MHIEFLRAAALSQGIIIADSAISGTPQLADALDAADPLASHRAQFHFPIDKNNNNTPYKYFCGNSLGLQHVGVEQALRNECTKWREQAVEGHFHQPNPWFEIDDVLRDDMASIVGAMPSEVVVMNSLTANLHLLLTAFYRPTAQRSKILSERFPFPSDTHAFVSQVELHGLNADECFITTGGGDGSAELREIPTQEFLDIIEGQGERIAVVVIGAVHFLTGQFFDIGKITAAAHAKGILVGVDAAHAVGNVPLELHQWGVDFACWCSYKYLNGGPGNIAGIFVHERHTSSNPEGTPSSLHQLRGWWGHERRNRFSLNRNFTPSAGAAMFQLSNPCVMAIASLTPSVKLCASIGMQELRKKSILLTAYLEYLIEMKVGLQNVDIITPRNFEHRGAQLSIRIRPSRLATSASKTSSYECGTNLNNDADLAQRLLLEHGVMCDNRPPDILRLAPVPTYNSFRDVYDLATILAFLFKQQ